MPCAVIHSGQFAKYIAGRACDGGGNRFMQRTHVTVGMGHDSAHQYRMRGDPQVQVRVPGQACLLRQRVIVRVRVRMGDGGNRVERVLHVGPLHRGDRCSILNIHAQRFAHGRTMDADTQLARIASAIGEPARARMLCCLLDGHAHEYRTVGHGASEPFDG